MNANTVRKWSTPLTIGIFVLMAVTGLLMFFHWDSGFNKLAHEWVGLLFVFAVAMHVYANFASFSKHIKQPKRSAIIAVCVGVLALSFISLPGVGKPSPRIVIQKLVNVPIEQLVPASGKTSQDIERIFAAHGVDAVNMQHSISALAGNEQAFVVLTAIMED